MQPNMWIYGVHGFFKTFSSASILNRVSYFDGSTLELLESFQKTGLKGAATQWLVSQ